MKRISPPEDRPRFRANIRHYHRSGSPQETGWKEWVDGSGSPFARKKAGWSRKIVLGSVLIAAGVLAAVFLGLIPG